MTDELKALWARYHKRRKIADRNLLVEHYRPLVEFHAKRLKGKLPPEVELDDMVSTGIFGLVDAIDAFDPGRGVKFESFSTLRIRGAMLDELRNVDWVPRLVRLKAGRLKGANESLERQLGRKPTVTELAKRLKLKVCEVEQLQRDVQPVELISLFKKFFETDSFKDVTTVSLLADGREADPSCRLSAQDVRSLVTRSLNRNERLIILLYYWEGQTMKEIGKQIGLSESRVSQMHTQIIERLGRRLRERRPEIAAA